MPDITMCEGKTTFWVAKPKDKKQKKHIEYCPLRDTCNRYLITPDPEWQAYFREMPYKKGKCKNYEKAT